MPKLWTRGQTKKELQLTLERDTRIRTVMELVGQGIPVTKIAQQFSVDERTIYKDLELIRQHFKENTLAGDMLERVAHYNELQRMRVQRLWALYNKEGSTDKQKLKVLQELRAEEELSIKKEQIIGLLPRERPDTAVQINNNVTLTEDQLAETITRLQKTGLGDKQIASHQTITIEHTARQDDN